MKKQVFAIAFTVLTVPSVLFAPAFGGSRAVNIQPAAKKPAGDQPAAGGTTVTTAAGLVAAFPGSEADLVAGAIAGSGITPGNESSAAGQAAKTFVKKGTVFTGATSKQSARLGRLSK